MSSESVGDDDRDGLFDRVKQMNDEERYEDALDALKELVTQDVEVDNQQIELISWIINNRTTSAAFGDEKKAACYSALEILESIKLRNDPKWLENYESSLYDCFSKLNRCVRDEERENAWCRLKELYMGLLELVHDVWENCNEPERLALYASLSKLIKFYLDVADDETMQICLDAASKAKHFGRGELTDEQFMDCSDRINEISKNIKNAMADKKNLDL